jgi:hypothetical protein
VGTGGYHDLELTGPDADHEAPDVLELVLPRTLTERPMASMVTLPSSLKMLR